MIINGKVGDGTSMNVLELITESGNVLYIDKSGAKVNCKDGLIIGENISVDVTLTATSITEI